MARLLVKRIHLRDYPTVQGIIILIAVMVSLSSLIVDLVYAWIDPRVKY
jgi:peptide/nickel transport system permease protein